MKDSRLIEELSVTADTGSVIWASPEEVKTIDDIVTSANIIRIDRGFNMA